MTKMFFARILLLVNGATFALYGLACALSPTLVADYAGMVLPGASALTEVVAMYGGLQAGVGILFLYAGLSPERTRGGLAVMVILIGSLALARTFGLLMHGTSAYNLGALAYESVSALLAFIGMRRLSAPEAGG